MLEESTISMSSSSSTSSLSQINDGRYENQAPRRRMFFFMFGGFFLVNYGLGHLASYEFLRVILD